MAWREISHYKILLQNDKILYDKDWKWLRDKETNECYIKYIYIQTQPTNFGVAGLTIYET